MFHKSFKCNSGKFQGCFKKVSRVYHESFKGVSWKFQGCFKGDLSRMFQESLKDVSRKSKGCFEGVLRVFQGSFKKTFKVFQKSFMLHGTHCTFPSRRWACLDWKEMKNLELITFVFIYLVCNEIFLMLDTRQTDRLTLITYH